MGPHAPQPAFDHLDLSLDPSEARALRERLVELVAYEVSDTRVIEAMLEIPRHVFAPRHSFGDAYADRPLPIGHGATISQPSLVGLMSEALELTGKERILEIGTGSGYQAAVLSRLAREIYSVEIVPSLAERAADVLARIGASNVMIKRGDGWKGWPEHAPYDRIVVTAAPDVLPDELLAQLAPGGMLLVPVGPQSKNQRLERWWRENGHAKKEDLGAVRFVPMVHGKSDLH